MNNSNNSKFYRIIFKSNDNPVYICRYVNKNYIYINRDEKVMREEINYTEYDLKVAQTSKFILGSIRIIYLVFSFHKRPNWINR